MQISQTTTLRELAFIVCTALEQAGEIAVLSGGGAATVYAPEAYQSHDLDFIFAMWSAGGPIKADALTRLGFVGRLGSYTHPLSPYSVDFPAGPLAVGDEMITSWETLREGDLLLHILSPTDCVRDRLAWFFYGRDHSALDQAVAVALRCSIDLSVINAWAEREGQKVPLAQFLSRLR